MDNESCMATGSPPMANGAWTQQHLESLRQQRDGLDSHDGDHMPKEGIGSTLVGCVGRRHQAGFSCVWSSWSPDIGPLPSRRRSVEKTKVRAPLTGPTLADEKMLVNYIALSGPSLYYVI